MQTFRLNSPTIFVWLVLLPLGCAAVDDGGGAAGQGDRAETQQGGPTKEQIEAMMAEAYERASKPPQYIQHIVAPDDSAQFALYTDVAGFDDVSWYVLKLDPDTDPKALNIPKVFTRASTDSEKAWMAKTLFWNWSEAGHHNADPQIKIVKDRYLVFVRGGLNHALYDIQTKEVLVSEVSPWHGLVASGEYDPMDPEPSVEEVTELMDAWVRQHLHDPIERIVQR
jgi:hypothetical protein